MLDKIKNIYKQPFWQNLRDIRFLGFAVFAVMVILATWSGVSVIETNYTLQKQVATAEQKNQISQLENTKLKLQNEYLNTDTFLELTARKQLGRGAPGETLLLVPKTVALAHAKELPAVDSQAKTTPETDNRPKYQQNISAWWDFMLGRGV